MTTAQSGASTEVLRWLATDRDVVVRGDRGSGKTTTLNGVLDALSDRRVPGVLLRAGGGGPLSAFLDHPSAPVPEPGEAEAVAWLAGELAAPRSVLLVDDLDRLDSGSVRVAHRVLTATGSRLIATSTRDLVRAGPAAVRDLLAARAPAEVRVPALDLAGMASLVSGELPGPLDSRVVIALHAQSQGNPGAARALVAAGRATGVLWPEARRASAERLAELPVDAIAALFLGRLDPAALDAIETLAQVGPLPRDGAARLIDPGLIDELVDLGRIVAHDAGRGEPVLAVAPPVLARAVRERCSGIRRRRVVAAARAGLGDTSPVPASLSAPPAPPAAGAGAGDPGVLLEGAATRESAARADWVAAPGLRTANAYLAELMSRPAPQRIDQVLHGTPRRPEDTVEDAAATLYYRARWAAWCGDDPDAAAVDGPVDPRIDGLAAWLELDALAEQVVTAIRDGAQPEAVAAAEPDPVPVCVLRGGPELLTAAALLESGRPDLALDVARRGRRIEDLTPNARHYLIALDALSLVQLDEPGLAERTAGGALAAAYRGQDVVGARVHGAVLAEALAVAGDTGGAWRELDRALRLGPSGPVETTFHRRSLAMACILQARSGRVELARSLLQELGTAPRAHRPLLRSLQALAAVAVALATGDRVRAADLAWRAGRGYADAGLRQPALLTWALAPLPPLPERAAVLRATRAGTVLPLLDPLPRSAERDRRRRPVRRGGSTGPGGRPDRRHADQVRPRRARAGGVR